MDTSIQTLIAQSALLNDKEKAYWTQSLPKMTQPQVARLTEILQRAASSAWNQTMERSVAFIGNVAKSYLMHAHG